MTGAISHVSCGKGPHHERKGKANHGGHVDAVWAIIGYIQAIVDPITTEANARTAVDYLVPVAAVTVALAYYERHRAAIDTLVAINAAAVEERLASAR